MDPTRFDQLTRLLSRASGRRSVLATLLGAVLGGATNSPVAAKRRDHDNRRHPASARDQEPGHQPEQGQDLATPEQGQRQGQGQVQDQAAKKGTGRRHGKKPHGGHDHDHGGSGTAPCCGIASCAAPKPGALRKGCDYGSQDFSGRDLRGAQFPHIDGRGSIWTGADLRGAHFIEACLQGARFRRADLRAALFGKACLFAADFTGAKLDPADATFAQARFCGTILPDGSVNNRDCRKPTRCCQQEAEPGPSCQQPADCPAQACQTKTCTQGQCVYTIVSDGPDPSGQCTTHCCEGGCCNPGATECNPLGLCCTPNCADRNCGDDGCGGSCGTCPDGTVCFVSSGRCFCSPGTCDGCCADISTTCAPGTTNQHCGAGGAPCATCAGQETCQDGACVCVPNCTGRTCGPDGCGGSCGTCPTGLTCDDGSGQCQCTTASCPNGCCSDGPGNPGACLPGDTDQSCNKGGLRCVACASGSTCGGRGCQPVDCGDLCGTRFCLNLVEGTVSCQVPFSDVCNDTDPDLTFCTATADCSGSAFTLCVASFTDPTTNQTEFLTCGGQPGALCARDIS